jgi:hypothetical protein
MNKIDKYLNDSKLQTAYITNTYKAVEKEYKKMDNVVDDFMYEMESLKDDLMQDANPTIAKSVGKQFNNMDQALTNYKKQISLFMRAVKMAT